MVELGQQGQPAMRGHGLLRPFRCESEHRVSSHAAHPVGSWLCVVAHP